MVGQRRGFSFDQHNDAAIFFRKLVAKLDDVLAPFQLVRNHILGIGIDTEIVRRVKRNKKTKKHADADYSARILDCKARPAF